MSSDPARTHRPGISAQLPYRTQMQAFDTRDPISDRMGWMGLAFAALAMFGNFCVCDSVASVARMQSSQLGSTDAQTGMLTAIYSIPNVALVLVGGMRVLRDAAIAASNLYASRLNDVNVAGAANPEGYGR